MTITIGHYGVDEKTGEIEGCDINRYHSYTEISRYKEIVRHLIKYQYNKVKDIIQFIGREGNVMATELESGELIEWVNKQLKEKYLK